MRELRSRCMASEAAAGLAQRNADELRRLQGTVAALKHSKIELPDPACMARSCCPVRQQG